MTRFNDATMELLGLIDEKKANGKRLTMSDKVLLRLSDGEWHEAAELAYNVSWRFGGYLHNLKQMGVDWEKERVPEAAAQVFRYRLCDVDDNGENHV